MDPLRKRFLINGKPAEGSTLHTPYLRPVGVMLDQLKQRMAAGGLSQLAHRHTTEDGATLTVMSRFGQGEVRIDVPYRQGATVVTQDQPRKDAELSLDDFLPYLWVGAKLISGGLDEQGAVAVKIHLCVWEPGVRASLSGDAKILSNRHRLVDDETDETVYPLQHNDLVDDPDGAEDQIALTPANFYQKKDGTDPADNSEWDEIAVCDPNDPNFRGRIKGGTYQVKVMMAGADCPTITPSVVRLRVRVGKGLHARMREEEIEIAEATNYRRGIVPFGWFDPWESRCSGIADNGPNVHAPHWWQGGALAYVPEIQVGVPAEQLRTPAITFKDLHIPDAGFAPGEFPAKAERCTVSVKVLWGGIAVTQVSGEYCAQAGSGFKYCGSDSFDDIKAVIGVDPGSLQYGYLGCGEGNPGDYASHYTSGLPPPAVPATTPAKWYDFFGGELGGTTVQTWIPPGGGSCTWFSSLDQISHPDGGNYLISTAYYRPDTNAWTILPGIVPFAEVEAIVKAEMGVNRVCLYSDLGGWGGCAV